MAENNEKTSMECFARAWLHANPTARDENVFNSHRFTLVSGESLTYSIAPASGWVLFIKHIFVEDHPNTTYRFIVGNLTYQYDNQTGETPSNEIIALKPIRVGESDIIQVYAKNTDTITRSYSLYISGFGRRTEDAGVVT